MSDFRQVTDDFWASPQITLADVADAKALGVALIVNNRPEGEAPDQVPGAVIEAAAQGRDAWVDFPRPPAWLGEFWERYGMHRSGTTPTPPPPRPAREPARLVAEVLQVSAG